MPILLACAVPAERDHVLAALGLSRDCGETRIELPCGQAAVLVTGIGPVNAAWRLAEALAATPEATGVVDLGIAGSFDLSRAPLLATTVATAEIWPEFGLRQGADVDARAIGFALHPRGPVFDTIALDPDRSAREMGLRLASDWIRGPSLTVAGVSAEAERAAYLAGRYQALTENMEGFPLALICHDKGLPFLEVRVVSNLAGSRDAADWRLKGALRQLGQTARTLFGPGRAS